MSGAREQMTKAHTQKYVTEECVSSKPDMGKKDK